MSAGFYWTLCGLYDEYKSVHTPESHEDGEEDSGWVVKQVASSSCTTRCHQLPVAAGVVAQRTHGDVVPRITNFHTGKQGRMEELFKGMEEGQRMVQSSLDSGYVAKNKNMLVLKCEEQDTML